MNFEPYTGKFPDLKESFDLGSAESQTLPDNWIPDEDLPGYQTYATNFYNTCREFQLSILLPALALGLDLPRTSSLAITKQTGTNSGYCTIPELLPAYSRVAREERSEHTWISEPEHTGTLLFQDDCGGLEVETPSQPVALMHVPPFLGEKEKTIECLPGCSGPDKPKKYEPIKAGEYINMRLNVTY
ncbi:hypothetical protein GG344DRAFT_69014 [Lentinula edodes]|nr:hypothetical protein GG344DRAFT_69014 [Lentinula edodes]